MAFRHRLSQEPKQLNFFSFLKWKCSSQAKGWPKRVSNRFCARPKERVADSSLVVTFVGHSSFLLQTCGINILTDPVWSQRVGPWNLFGPKRVSDPGIAWEDLPKIDLVLVSHDHYDHLDVATLHRLWLRDGPLFVVPLGLDAIIRSRKPAIPVEALEWNEAKQVAEHCSVHLEPARHWSGRGLFDRGKSLWGAFVIQTPSGKIYFAGDTAYGEGSHFRACYEKHGPFRLALLPIGAYEPRWFMRHFHMNPEEAVLSHKDLGEPFSLGMHFATFRLADEGYDDATKDLQRALVQHSVSSERFCSLEIGESINVQADS